MTHCGCRAPHTRCRNSARLLFCALMPHRCCRASAHSAVRFCTINFSCFGSPLRLPCYAHSMLKFCTTIFCSQLHLGDNSAIRRRNEPVYSSPGISTRCCFEKPVSSINIKIQAFEFSSKPHLPFANGSAERLPSIRPWMGRVGG